MDCIGIHWFSYSPTLDDSFGEKRFAAWVATFDPKTLHIYACSDFWLCPNYERRCIITADITKINSEDFEAFVKTFTAEQEQAMWDWAKVQTLGSI